MSVFRREHNFSRTFSSAQAFGEGVYFATEAAYSANPRYSKPNHAGQQFMILTKVLVGRKPAHPRNHLPEQKSTCFVWIGLGLSGCRQTRR